MSAFLKSFWVPLCVWAVAGGALAGAAHVTSLPIKGALFFDAGVFVLTGMMCVPVSIRLYLREMARQTAEEG